MLRRIEPLWPIGLLLWGRCCTRQGSAATGARTGGFLRCGRAGSCRRGGGFGQQCGVAGGAHELTDQPRTTFAKLATALRGIERNRYHMTMHKEGTAPMGATGALGRVTIHI